MIKKQMWVLLWCDDQGTERSEAHGARCVVFPRSQLATKPLTLTCVRPSDRVLYITADSSTALCTAPVFPATALLLSRFYSLLDASSPRSPCFFRLHSMSARR